MATKSPVFLLALALSLAGISAVSAQNIRGYYVSKTQEDGTIYHTLPCTLFEHPDAGALTFDITYKEHQDNLATINFTYAMDAAIPADSVVFVSGRTQLRGPAAKLYIEPDKKRWKHRYSFRTPVASLCTFFDAQAVPEVTLYAGGRAWVYRVKRSAWRNYAPVGYKIFEMVRVNESAR